MEHSQYRTIVKRVYPHEGRRKVLIAFFALMLATATGIFVGMYAREEFPALEGGATASREQIAQLSLEAEADRQTISTLRDQLSERVSELAELEEILSFYRGALAPEYTKAPIVLRPPKIRWDSGSEVWRVKLMVHRGVVEQPVFQGEVFLKVHGSMAGKSKTVDVVPLDTVSESGVFPMRFQYLQEFEGVISYSDGFIPEKIETIVTLVKPMKDRFQRRDVWEDRVYGNSLSEAGF